MKPLGKVKIEWSPEFVYALGLIATDGNLSGDGRHISLSSKDREQIKNFIECLKLKNKIGVNKSRFGKLQLRVQFGDVMFYNFLVDIGFMPNKTKILGKLEIPREYFFDFLRGHFDGDGSFHSYFDPRWKSSYMFYTIFVSASKKHIDWIREVLDDLLGIKGHITKADKVSWYQLKYAKAESLKLLPKLYSGNACVCLSRKRLKIKKALSIIGVAL